MSVAVPEIDRADSIQLEEKFRHLVESWKKECPPSSKIEKLIMQPSYQRIIGMGPDVLPLIMRELNQAPDHWFWALQSITGVNPVQPANRGNMGAMIADWNSWYASHEG